MGKGKIERFSLTAILDALHLSAAWFLLSEFVGDLAEKWSEVLPTCLAVVSSTETPRSFNEFQILILFDKAEFDAFDLFFVVILTLPKLSASLGLLKSRSITVFESGIFACLGP